MRRTSGRARALVAGAAAILIALLTWNGASAQEDKDAKQRAAQIARGAKLWAETCNHCHNLRDPQELTDEDWDVSVNHMRVRANLPGDVARAIKAFLKSSN